MNDNERLTSVVFRLGRDRLTLLKGLSKETRIRQSEYLREAISDLLLKYADDSSAISPNTPH
jgi:predicted DNA-binding protein